MAGQPADHMSTRNEIIYFFIVHRGKQIPSTTQPLVNLKVLYKLNAFY